MWMAMVVLAFATSNACTSDECDDFHCGGYPVGLQQSFVYVANDASAGGGVSAFHINGADARFILGAQVDASSGSLTEINGSPFAASSQPLAMVTAISSAAIRFAYVAHATGAISGYAIDPRTGALIPIAGSPFPVAAGAPRLIAQWFDSFLYVATQNAISLYAMDVNTGALKSSGAPVAAGPSPSSMVFALGKFAYVANMASNDISAYSIDNSTRALAPIGTFPAGMAPQALALDPLHKFLYAANSGSNDIGAYSIDATTGALASLGPAVPAGSMPTGLALYRAGKFLYATNFGSNDVRAYAMDAATGALAAVGVPVPTGIGPRGPVIQEINQLDASLRRVAFLYVANSGSNTVSAYRIDTTSGTLTGIGAPVPSGTNPVGIATATVLTGL
jgi:6-phosphogluconolactonase